MLKSQHFQLNLLNTFYASHSGFPIIACKKPTHICDFSIKVYDPIFDIFGNPCRSIFLRISADIIGTTQQNLQFKVNNNNCLKCFLWSHVVFCGLKPHITWKNPDIYRRFVKKDEQKINVLFATGFQTDFFYFLTIPQANDARCWGYPRYLLLLV